MLFKYIRKCLDDFENTVDKLDKHEKITKEEEDAIWYSDLRLAEALMKNWSGAERVAMIILAEKGIPEKFEVKFNNKIAFKDE